MKILFMGTPDFSASVLRKLASEHNVIAAVTGLDKPVGRGHRLMPSPVKVAAEELGIPVLQFERVSSRRGSSMCTPHCSRAGAAQAPYSGRFSRGTSARA